MVRSGDNTVGRRYGRMAVQVGGGVVKWQSMVPTAVGLEQTKQQSQHIYKFVACICRVCRAAQGRAGLGRAGQGVWGLHLLGVGPAFICYKAERFICRCIPSRPTCLEHEPTKRAHAHPMNKCSLRGPVHAAAALLCTYDNPSYRLFRAFRRPRFCS